MSSTLLYERLISRLAMFSIAGLINTIIGATVIVLCTAIGLGVFTANAIGYGAGLVFSFAFNSRITFRGRQNDSGTVWKFLVSFALAFGLNLGIVFATHHFANCGEIVTSLAGTPAYTIAFFLLCDHWVFASKSNDHTGFSQGHSRKTIHD